MNVIIVDDEKNARLALRGILEENFPEVTILDECVDVPSAVKSIHKHQPDLVFLDISMPGYSGLELFKFLDESELNFKVVFVTAYSEYALNAFELSAADYILKPVRLEALQRALNKVKENKTNNFRVLQENLEEPQHKKVALQTGDGLTFLLLENILYLKADGSYTHFITTDNKKITVTKKIADFERLEQMGSFLRIHRSHLINYNRIQKIMKQDGGTVVMDNGDLLSISTDKKQQLLDLFERNKL
ncbi:MAG: response regulator [Flavobacterium sp.]|nr:response regulator [Flavobacterium sp.]